jgi:hypothetical protein
MLAGAEGRAKAGKSVYPFPPVGEHPSDTGAGSASGQLLRKRSTRSGLLMKGRPKAIRSACPAAIACSAVSLVWPQLPISGPWNPLQAVRQASGPGPRAGQRRQDNPVRQSQIVQMESLKEDGGHVLLL